MIPRALSLVGLAAILGALAACARDHAGAVELRAEACVSCHLADYQATTMPDHEADGKPTDCATCHSTRGWTPAAGGHPEDRFPITTGPHLRDCLDCHKESIGPTFTGGENTDCVGCHEGAHTRDVVERTHLSYDGYAWDAANPHFCLRCHPRGLAGGGGHPEAAFPIASGAHRFACLDCHDSARGSPVDGGNTDCVGCHTGEHTMSRVNAQHGEVSGYVFDPAHPNFCLRCHPNGRH